MEAHDESEYGVSVMSHVSVSACKNVRRRDEQRTGGKETQPERARSP